MGDLNIKTKNADGAEKNYTIVDENNDGQLSTEGEKAFATIETSPEMIADTDTVFVGADTKGMTGAEYKALISGSSTSETPAPQTEAAPVATETPASSSKSIPSIHKLEVEAGLVMGVGKYAHSGYAANIRYPRVLDKYNNGFTLLGSVGLSGSKVDMIGNAPNGEEFKSGITTVGLEGGVRLQKDIKKLTLSGGLFGEVGYSKSIDGNEIAIPQGECTPEDERAGLCDPDMAGPRGGPDGLGGRVNPRTGGALPLSELYVKGRVRAEASYQITYNLKASLAAEAGIRRLAGGDPVNLKDVSVLAGVTVALGSKKEIIAAQQAESTITDETVDASAIELTPELNDAGKTTITLDEAKVRELAGLKPSDVITGISIDGGPEQKLPATFELEPGKHTLGVNYNDGIDGKKHHRDVTILVGPLKAGIDDAGNIIGTSLLSGVNPNKNVNVPMMPAQGVSQITKTDEKSNVNLGSFTPVKNIPAGVTVSVRVGDKTVYEDTTPLKGNEAYSIVMPGFANIGNNWVAKDYATPGAKEKVQLVFKSAKGKEIATLDWPSYTVAPAIATLTEAAVISTPKKGQYYRNGETIRVRVVSDKDTKAVATMIGEKYKQTLSLKKGENFIDVPVTQVNAQSTKRKNELAVYIQPTNDSGAVEGVKVRAMPHTFVQKGGTGRGSSGSRPSGTGFPGGKKPS